MLVCGIGALPLLAIRFGKLPTAAGVPAGRHAGGAGFSGAGSGALDAARERPERGTVFAAVARTEEMLTGMLLGHAVLAVGAFLVLAAAGGTAGRILIAVVGGRAAAALAAVRHPAPADARW